MGSVVIGLVGRRGPRALGAAGERIQVRADRGTGRSPGVREAVRRRVLDRLFEQGEDVDGNDTGTERAQPVFQMPVVERRKPGERVGELLICLGGRGREGRGARIGQVEDHDMTSAGLPEPPDPIDQSARRLRHGNAGIDRREAVVRVQDGIDIVDAAPDGIQRRRIRRARRPPGKVQPDLVADPGGRIVAGSGRVHAGAAEGVVGPAGKRVRPRRAEGLRHDFRPDRIRVGREGGPRRQALCQGDIAGIAQAVAEHHDRAVFLRPGAGRADQRGNEERENAESKRHGNILLGDMKCRRGRGGNPLRARQRYRPGLPP